MLSTLLTRAAAARPAAVLLAAVLLLAGCATPAEPPPPAPGPEPPTKIVRAGPAEIPGLGPDTRRLIPDGTSQAVVVTGEDADSSNSEVVLYERDPGRGWQAVVGPWPAHNGLKGWTDEHWAGDNRSPTGVFGLTDAGGRLPDPGTKLPYHESPSLFTVAGTGFLGEPLEGSFDYVVAINYNRRPGTSPLYDEGTRPMGWDRGGGVWFHVDHDGPTQACVSLELDQMRELLLWLDPERDPVVVMGDGGSLAR